MSKLFKRKNSPYWWWTGRYKGARYRRSTKMIKERLAQKVKDHWDLNLMLDKLEFLGPSFNKSITNKIILLLSISAWLEKGVEFMFKKNNK